MLKAREATESLSSAVSSQKLNYLLQSSKLKANNIGVWRSWLARAVWDREVEGSSPFTPTTKNVEYSLDFFRVFEKATT